MAIQQVVPIFITLLGDGSNTVFTYALAYMYQGGFGGSVPFGTAGVVPSSIIISNPPFPITSSTVDANGNVTITFTSPPPASLFTLEVDIYYNSGLASSASPTQTQNVNITNTTITVAGTVSIGSTVAQNQTQLNGVALGSPSNFGVSPGAISVQGVNASMFSGTTALTNTGGSLNVNITGGSAGGTQYTTGTAVATPIGTAALGWDGTDVRVLSTTSAGALYTLGLSNSNTALATWNSGTTVNTTVAVSNATDYGTVAIAFSQSAGTFSTGVITFEGSLDNTNWVLLTGVQPNSTTSSTIILASSNYTVYIFHATPYPFFRLRLSTAITGTGVVTLQSYASSNASTEGVSVYGTVSIVNMPSAVSPGGAAPGTQLYVGGLATTAAPTYGNNTAQPLSFDGNGNLRVSLLTALPAGANVIGAVTQSGGPWTINETQINGVALGSPSNYGTSPGAVSVQGVNAFITNTVPVTLASTTITGTVAVTQSTSPWVVSGTVTANAGTGTFTVAGTLTHNNAAPAANNVGALVAVASTAAPTYTTGDQVLLSTDLAGNLRVSGTFAAGALADLVGAAGTLNAANTTATINAFGYGSVGMFLAAGTLVGTIIAEASLDGGTTWVMTYFSDATTGITQSTIVFGSANTATSKSLVGVAGASNYRVRVSAFTSGTATCTLRANQIDDPSTLIQAQVGATTQPAFTAQNGGWVTTGSPTYSTATLNALSLTTGGGLRVDNSSWAGTALGAPTNYGTAPGAVAVIGVNSFLTQFPASAAAADALANPTITQVGVENMVYNGTTWDRARSASVGNTVAATGLPVGVGYGEFLTTLPTLTTGTYGAIQLDASGRQIVVAQDTPVGSTALGAANATITIALQGQTSCGFQLIAGTLIGTIVAEISFDGGTTWNATGFIDPARSSYFNQYVFASANGAQSASIDTSGGATHARVRVSAYTSGTANAFANASKVGRGTITTTLIDGQKVTYRVAVVAATPLASTTAPSFSMTGSSTKIIKILKIRVSVSASTGTACDVILNRYTALSGGTAVSQSANIAKMDSQNPTATAVVNNWTAAATTHTVAGIVSSERFEIVTAAISVQPQLIEWDFGVAPGAQALILRGTSEFLGICFSAVGTTPISDIWIEWTEE